MLSGRRLYGGGSVRRCQWGWCCWPQGACPTAEAGCSGGIPAQEAWVGLPCAPPTTLYTHWASLVGCWASKAKAQGSQEEASSLSGQLCPHLGAVPPQVRC